MTQSDDVTPANDELMERLARLDPTRSDAPPAAGSVRFTSIKDGIMQSQQKSSTTPTTTEATDNPTIGETPFKTAAQTRSSTKLPAVRRYILAAAAAIVAVLAIGASVLSPGATVSAEAAVLAAVQNSAELTDFRMDMVTNDITFLGTPSVTIEVDGQNAHVSGGDIEGYIVGETAWFSDDGGATFEVTQEAPLPSYTEASNAVIMAALTSEQVNEAGTQTIRGVETTLYEITIDDAAAEALAKLSREEMFWFVETTEEECFVSEDGETVEDCVRRGGFLEDADSISIWVADNLVHQIAVDSGSTQFTHTIYDLGEDITVSAPE